MLAFVTSPAEVVVNIRNYGKGVRSDTRLAERIKRHSVWYAAKDGDVWHFGPTKFVGYAGMDSSRYFSEEGKHGGQTEANADKRLLEWFRDIDLNSTLGRELDEQFRRFVGKFGKTPNKKWRVKALVSDIGQEAQRDLTSGGDWRKRIAIDQRICGGRPHIGGTRVRVSDVLDMLACGVSRETILADFPYLQSDDIDASLHYAAASVSHRVMRAA